MISHLSSLPGRSQFGVKQRPPLQSMQSPAIVIKAADLQDDGTFSGYGSLFGVLDDGGDVVMPGAFSASLAAHKAAGTMPKLLEQHDPAKPIGIWLDMVEDDRGLLCKGRLLLEVQRAREVHALLKGGAIDGLSIGYAIGPDDWSYADSAEQARKFGWYGGGVSYEGRSCRLLHKCDLWEVSVVTFPMLRSARIDDVKHQSHDAAGLAALSAAVDRLSAAIDRR